jgi:anti-sigma regulatory factor (Ser/Thr protein kinase)
VSRMVVATVLEPTRSMPGAARRFVRRVLEATDAEVALDTAELLTSELVTNAVVHVGSSSELVITTMDGGVRVEVTDHDGRLPAIETAGADATHGRGLAIVDALADAWGVDGRADNGKTVWFELSLGTTPLHAVEPGSSSPCR